MSQLKLLGIPTRIFGIISLVLAISLVGQAQAQSRAQKSIITQLLWQSLLQCYSAPDERIEIDDEVVLGVVLNTKGDIGNLPDLKSPIELSTGERALLREATVALISCTPIISGGGDKTIYGEFDIVANREGLSIDNVEAFVGRAEVVVTLDMLEVEEIEQAAEPEVAASVETTKTSSDELTEIAIPTPSTNVGVGTQSTEAALELTKTERREIQRRLTLLDYDTRGIDGVFGPGSRAAVRDWQSDNSMPISGYLNLNQLVTLREMSDVAYMEWESRPKRYYGSDGCLREPDGRILQNRSFKCDLKAASQNLGLSN